MIGLRLRHVGLARAFAALALLAMVVRAIVPVGYMLAPVHDARFVTVALCSSHGAVNAIVDLATGDLVNPQDIPERQSPSDERSFETPCLFAVSPTLAAPVSEVAIVVLLRLHRFAWLPPVLVAPGLGLAAPPPWPTGPPGFA